MLAEKLKKYSYIWNERKNEYVLIKTEYGYAIVDKREKSMLMISDDKLEEMIINNMLKHGNKIYENMDHAFTE